MLNIPVRYFEEKVEDFLARELYSSFELGQIKVICEIVTSYHNYFSSDLIAKVDRINEHWLAPEPTSNDVIEHVVDTVKKSKKK